jgi:hypothetical protein
MDLPLIGIRENENGIFKLVVRVTNKLKVR